MTDYTDILVFVLQVQHSTFKLQILTLPAIRPFYYNHYHYYCVTVVLFYGFLFFYDCVFPFRVCVVSEHPSGGDLKLMGIDTQEENIKNKFLTVMLTHRTKKNKEVYDVIHQHLNKYTRWDAGT